MARGPFQGAWQPNLRPTVVVAPDAIVYINGSMQVIGCPSCNTTFDINKYITNIQIDLNVDSAPGSASLSLSVPRASIDDFYFDGNPVITPMMEVEIFAKGYYLLEGIPQYYPIFWGLVTEVNDAYSGGAHTISISCADILKWWELCKVDTNPGLTAGPSQAGPSLFGNVFAGMNPYDVIFQLASQSFGDTIVATGSLATSYKEQAQQVTFDTTLSDITMYWQSRFGSIRNNLLMYGMSGVAVRGDTLYSQYPHVPKATGQNPSHLISNAIRVANGGQDSGQAQFDPSSPNVTAFRAQFSNSGIGIFTAEYSTKLEIANTCKECIGYEFFMDVDGSIVFKPPFYNLDVLANKPLSWIQDIDIIDWDFSESEAEVITQIIMQGSLDGGPTSIDAPATIAPQVAVTDYHLLRKYGWRSQTHNAEFLNDSKLMFYYGLDLLDRLNSRRHRGTVTIPLRPELRLGFPVYVAPKDQMWYVSGISHNISFGSRATTTLTLTAKRTKFIGLRGTGTLTLKNMAAGPTPAMGNDAALNAAIAAAVQQGAQQGSGSTQSTNSPAPTNAFPYTSQQLSAQGNFALNFQGSPAILPPINTDMSDQTADGTNPYQPVILQSPTTGRILGYPNVVMVYAGPYATSTPNLSNTDTNRGQATPGTSPAIQKNLQTKVTATQVQNDSTRTTQQIATITTTLQQDYISNRYTYGLTSAGRFVYANDQGSNNIAGSGAQGVIGEILVLPTSQLTITPKSQDPGAINLTDKVAIIRPISDERGFEVIGHYRYGRRVSLSDGSLVYTGNGVNTPVNIGMQLPLSGNLYDTLNAQSQGLTAISSAYPNPANAVANLQPTDLETAAVPAVQPDGTTAPINTGSSGGTATGTNVNFVAAAPLGTPQQTGATQNVGVQSSNLARALTLAEMEVQPNANDPGDPSNTCPCLLMRSDLAFLNTGYTIAGTSITGTATSDFTTLGNSLPGGSITATYGSTTNPSPLQQSITAQTQEIVALQTQLDAVQANANNINQTTNPIGWAAAQQTINQLRAQISAAEATLMDLQNELDMSQSNSSLAATEGTVPAPPAGTVAALAETFLTNLYNALDGPHQQLEHTLRGDYLPGGILNNSLIAAPQTVANNVNVASSALSTFGQNIGSATNDIPQALQNLQNQLTSSAQTSMLTAQISQQQTQLSSIQSQISALQSQISSSGSSVTTPGGQTLQQQMQALERQAAMLQQSIANASLQLQNTLPPPAATGTST